MLVSVLVRVVAHLPRPRLPLPTVVLLGTPRRQEAPFLRAVEVTMTTDLERLAELGRPVEDVIARYRETLDEGDDHV